MSLTVDIYSEQYTGRAERADARSDVAEAQIANKLGYTVKDVDTDFLTAKAITLTKSYDEAVKIFQTTQAKKAEAIEKQQTIISDLENRLWKLHGDKERVKDYIILREKYSEEVEILRKLQYPRRYVTQHDHAFASSYMNLTADPDAGFQKGAPIYILKQRPDIEEMIVGNVKRHVTVEEAVPPPPLSEVVEVPPPPRKKKALKLKRDFD